MSTKQKRGRGQPRRVPTRGLIEAICREIRAGCPASRAARAHGVSHEMHATRMRRGTQPGAVPLEAEYAEAVGRAIAEGEARLWRRVDRGTRARKGDTEAPHKAVAGRLALSAIHTRWGKRYLGWKAKAQELPSAPLPQVADEPSGALSSLTPQEFDRYRALAERARTDFSGLPLQEVAELQVLLRKMKGETQEPQLLSTTPEPGQHQ